MKKLIGFSLFFTAFLSGCGSVADMPQDRNDLIVTGEPAVDAAAIFYTPEEAASLNLTVNRTGLKTEALGPTNFVVMVNGPLCDRRLVRGKPLAVSALVYGSTNGEVFYVNYGLSSTALTNKQQLNPTGYGNMVAIFDLPAGTSAKFYYKITGNKGSVYDDSGKPFALDIYDSIVTLRLADGKLTVNYSGKACGQGNTIHAGWNNWNTVFDCGMNYVDYSIAKYASPGKYATTALDVVWWANYIDFVFCQNGNWDNNGGADWHYGLKPLVDATVNAVNGSQKFLYLYYSAGSLNPPIAHYGVDGWQNVSESTLYYNSSGQWTGYLTVSSNNNTLNVAFHDNNNNWENNSGKNWNFNIK